MSLGTNSSVVLHLDSRFATKQLETDKTTNYIYDLVEAIEVPDHETCEVSLYTATIPYSFYNVRTGVNDHVKMKWSGNGETADLTLTPGNYTATGLQAELQSLITHTIPSTTYLKQVVLGTASYSRQTIKFNFLVATDLGAGTLSIDFDTACNLFGFKSSGYRDFTGANEARALSSEICIDMNDRIHGLYVRQNLTTKSTLDNENGTFTNILARIPINTNPGGIIFHSPANTTHRATAGLRTIQSIGIKLTDDSNRAIDLNGLHWQISILISFKPVPPHVHPLTRVTRRLPHLIRGDQGRSFIQEREKQEEERQIQIQEAEVKRRRQRRRRKKGK